MTQRQQNCRHSDAAPWIMGISASHNGAYCLLRGNDIQVAIQEERLTGRKRARVYGGRGGLGFRYCLETARIQASDLSMVVVSCQWPATSEENDIWMNPDLRGADNVPRRFVSHHLAHAASAFATSGYQRAAILIVDGQGSPTRDLDPAAKRAVIDPDDEASEHLSLFRAYQSCITAIEIHAARRWMQRGTNGMSRFFSLGGMYSAVAEQIFGDPMEAGKVMGLAPYGKPTIPVDEFVRFNGNRLVFTNTVQQRFAFRDQWPRHKRLYVDLAASVQQALEVALLSIAKRLRVQSGETNLCFAGGVALNSVANQRLHGESGFEHVFIVPAAEDSGVAIGAAYLGLWHLGASYHPSTLRADRHGRCSTPSEIAAAIRSVPDVVAHRTVQPINETAERLARGQIGGWFHGGSELGPRALGSRSIVCSPCGERTKRLLNARVKYREQFRPFAPSILAEHAATWFDFGDTTPDSPFMLRVVPFRKEVGHLVPAVVHVDGTGRVQTLTPSDNGSFYDLVARFHAMTGVPILLNTSFNVRGEPIVESPLDALWCLLGTGLDFCAIGEWIVTKRSGFGGILNYTPAVVALEYSLHMDIVDGALQRSVQREDGVRVRAQSRWGLVDQWLPLRLLPLLARIDGRKNGRALLHSFGGSYSRTRFVQDLLLLRRMHIIELRADHAREN